MADRAPLWRLLYEDEDGARIVLGELAHPLPEADALDSLMNSFWDGRLDSMGCVPVLIRVAYAEKDDGEGAPDAPLHTGPADATDSFACPRCRWTASVVLTETYVASHPARAERRNGVLTLVATNALATDCPFENFNEGLEDYSLHYSHCGHDWDVPAPLEIDWI
jgi:hypothetical protein